jgi:hypothetical protein
MPVLDPNEIMFTAFEPKVANRFIMYLGDIPAYMVKSVSSPSFTDGVIKLDHINTYRKIRGKREWQNMTLSLYDPITPSGAQAVMEWARLGYESVTGRAGYADFYKKEVYLNMLGPVGDIIGEWVIKGAFVQSSNFGQYNWSTDEAISVELTIAMDYCVLNF